MKDIIFYFLNYSENTLFQWLLQLFSYEALTE